MSITTSDVYTGIWTDWSQDNWVLGSTITFTSSTGTLITLFLAFYVVLSVSNVWLLIAYGLFQLRQQSKKESHAIIRQQQAILKAGLSPASTSVRILKLYWAYRSTPSAFSNSWLLIVVSLLCALSTVTTVVFSSRIIISSPRIKVLLNSTNCGFFAPGASSYDTTSPESIAYNVELINTLTLATSYSRQCYNTTTDNAQCYILTTPAINWRTDWDTPCPFNNTCTGPAITLDTGPINSNAILGLNSPPADQIHVRKLTTCAPITQSGYTRVANSSDFFNSLPGDQHVVYDYGPAGRSDFTWALSMAAANITKAYTLAAQYYFSGYFAQHGFWEPKPEFNNTNGDGTILFLSSNALQFTKPCDDPIFSAHVASNRKENNGTLYLQDRLAGVVGCFEQYQFCSSSTTVCSMVGGLGDVQQIYLNDLALTAIQAATADMISFVLFNYASLRNLARRNPPDLVADKRAGMGLQLPLPENQWQIEVQDWHATVITLLQQGILQ
ncbi:hypothetical protein F4859DRAFT_525796 [Xylaria cf. heliscus]|nr:hypothetical protein F4859DRAFT_525796 [Xylaria cf. heliscus]